MRGEDLTVELEVVDAVDGSVTRFVAGRFPLTVGGEHADVPLPGAPESESSAPLAYFGLSAGGMFVQPAEGSRVSVNGTLVSTSHWLHDGDSVRIGGASLQVEDRRGVMRIRLRDAERPVEPNPPPRPVAGAGVAIKPLLFEPKSLDELRRETRSIHPGLVLLVLAAAFFGTAGWFIFTARSVGIEIEPPPDDFRIDGNLFDVAIGGRYLLRPGTYHVVADKEGFRPLAEEIVVSDSEAQQFHFALEKLPGLLLVSTKPSGGGAVVSVDGKEVGALPLPPIELAPGEHTVVVRRDRYRPFSTKVEIEGESSTVELEAPLEPLSAKVTFVSDPPGATVQVAGRTYGPTPVSVELLEGNHEYQAELPGKKPEHGRLRVVAGEDRTVRIGELSPVDGELNLLSIPGEASVTVDGAYRGQTPLRLVFSPGETHRIRARPRRLRHQDGGSRGGLGREPHANHRPRAQAR